MPVLKFEGLSLIEGVLLLCLTESGRGGNGEQGLRKSRFSVALNFDNGVMWFVILHILSTFGLDLKAFFGIIKGSILGFSVVGLKSLNSHMPFVSCFSKLS